jgi:hypothetical protein
MEITRYDFLGLWYQIVYILTGKWKGNSFEKASERMYCTEAVATWYNEVRPNTFFMPWLVNPLDIELNQCFRIKFKQECR